MRTLLKVWASCLIWFAIVLPAQAGIFETSPRDLQTEAATAAREGKRLVVLLTLPDCSGCLTMERRVFASPALQRVVAAKYRTVRLDISQKTPLIDPEGRNTTPAEFALRLHAVATPSFAFFDGKGEMLYRYTGALEADGFKALTRFVEREDYERHPFAPPKQPEHSGTLQHHGQHHAPDNPK